MLKSARAPRSPSRLPTELSCQRSCEAAQQSQANAQGTGSAVQERYEQSAPGGHAVLPFSLTQPSFEATGIAQFADVDRGHSQLWHVLVTHLRNHPLAQIGRASCRERV